MPSIPYWMPEFEKLYLKIASNPSSLALREEVQVFYQKFEGKEEYKRIRFDCENLMSTMYRHNGFIEKSFEMDLRLLAENHPETGGYWSLISQAVRTSDSLKRTNELIPFALSFLNTKDDNFSKKSIVLLWYAKVFAQQENSFFNGFEHIVRNLESFVEEKTDPTFPFLERLEYLNDKYQHALISSNSFSMAYSKANQAERPLLLKEYLASNPLTYYREFAIRNYM